MCTILRKHELTASMLLFSKSKSSGKKSFAALMWIKISFYRSISLALLVNMASLKKTKLEIWLSKSFLKIKECSYPDSITSETESQLPDED